MELKFSGELPAKTVCLIAHWASKAGARTVGQLARPPGMQSGSYSKHVDRVCGVNPDDDDFLWIDVPLYNKVLGETRSRKFPILPPHEALMADLDRHPEDLQRLQKTWTDWPPCFSRHTVVERHRDSLVLPVALYLDGVEFATRDNLVAIVVENMVSRRRFLCATIRRSTFCRCGCGGWCSLWPILDAINWSLLSLASGKWPARAPGGVDFEVGDVRGVHAGKPLTPAAVGWLKGDWAELVHTLGVRGWSHNTYPCFLCDCTKYNWADISGYDVLHFPHELRPAGSVDAACRACERRFSTTSVEEAAELRSKLFFDNRRSYGSKGLALSENFKGLEKGDKLVPSAELRNIHDLLTVSHPRVLTFWRPKSATWMTGRNPLWNPATGVDPAAIFAIDWLHTLSLGVFGFYITLAIHMLLDVDNWSVRDGNEKSRGDASFNKVSAELKSWYKMAEEGKRATQIQNLSFSLFGTRNDQGCRLKGSEANGFLVFLVTDVLPRSKAFPGKEQVLKAGNALLNIYRLIHQHSLKFRPAAIQSFVDSCKTYLLVLYTLDIDTRPKDHLLMHMGPRILQMGSPRLYGCWKDEDANRRLKGIARAAHAAVWERRMLSECQAWADLVERKRSRESS